MRDKIRTVLKAGTALVLSALPLGVQAKAEPLPRTAPAAGAVIDRKAGEEVRFVDLSNWQNVELKQNLLGGDILRTNALGQLAILFADHTQVRLGRNSALQVKQMGVSEDTVLNLQSGTMWARAQRGGQGLTVETPAAAAAIRGTDWSMTVKGDQTSLIVLEGEVEFRNEFGSVDVREGEGAVAKLGQAPRKLVIVTPEDRQQMLFYLTLRDGFSVMPATPLPSGKIRSERARIENKAPSSRSTEDWLVLAEVQMALDSQRQVQETLSHIRERRLSPKQRARLDLIDGLIAGSGKRYAEAARLFSRAARALDPKRRSIAAYGGYFARSLLDPNHAEEPPSAETGPYSAIMKAYTQGFLKDIPAAIDLIRQSEKRYPEDATLPAVRALLATLVGNRAEMKEASDRSLALDPQSPDGLQARALLRSDYESDLRGAIADLKEAIRIAPGSSSAWNQLGLILGDQGASREAEAAFLKASELDPDDPVAYANMAILYLDQSRMKEAKAMIDRALAVDPAFDIGLVARGRYYLQSGETDKALEDLLAGATANPGYSQAQIMLAAGHHMQGDRAPTQQALDNADRLDPNDPVAPSIRTTLAIDNYDGEGAIRNAQELLRRSRAQGGDYATLSANQDAGSTLNNAFRLLGLDAWGRYYGDAVFDPFTGSSYVDQSVRGDIDPYANNHLFGGTTSENGESARSFSSLMQGLLLDPHMLSSRNRTATLLRTPFLETSLGGGFTGVDGDNRRTGEAEVQGFSNTLMPLSFLGNISWTETPADGLYRDAGAFATQARIKNASGFLTASPTAYDRVVIYGNHAESRFDLASLSVSDGLGIPLPLLHQRNEDTTADSFGLGWSHTLSYRNVINTALLYSGSKSTKDRYYDFNVPAFFDPFRQVEREEQKAYVGAFSHMIGGDDLAVRYGLEAGLIDAVTQQVTDGIPSPEVTDRTHMARAYVDVLHEFTPDLKAEYAGFFTSLEGDNLDMSRFEPRLGLSYSPFENHLFRAGFIRQGFDLTTPTLAPVGILGLQPLQTNLSGTGYADTLAMEWDAEWTDNFFTVAEYQHQDLNDFSIDLPSTNKPRFDLPSPDSVSFASGTIDRASLTANAYLGHGFGLSATIARANSRNNDVTRGSPAAGLPFVPETAGQIALTYVSDINVKTTIAANYTGDRDGDEQGTRLDGYWTLDASLVWEPFDKSIALEASAYNLLDEDFDIAPDTPGWGPSFKGMLKVRF